MLLSRVWQAALRHPPTKPIHVYVDEWQKIPTPALAHMLAEGRKFGLSLRLANQNSVQIPPLLWETAIGNTGAVISYRTGPRDAERLAPLYRSISAIQLTQLPDHWVAVTTGGRDFIAPGPSPLPSDGGTALANGHVTSIQLVRQELLAAVARTLSAHVVNITKGRPRTRWQDRHPTPSFLDRRLESRANKPPSKKQAATMAQLSLDLGTTSLDPEPKS
jgi:hypothetical protein